MYTLENNYLKASFSAQGAEICNLVHKKTGNEHIWQADPKVWARHAPVLFPVVGRVLNDSYQTTEGSFSFGQHGFARDMEFSVLEHSADSIIFMLEANNETQKKYPYLFELRIQYTLAANVLDVEYTVVNKGKSEMYFSIGAHPGFNYPFGGNEQAEDYFLEFETAETCDRLLITPEGYITNTREPFFNQSNRLPLRADTFKRGALVFDQLQSTVVSLKSEKHSRSLLFRFRGYPFFGIWAAPGAPFVCLEPWHGIADFVDDPQPFAYKKGIRQLNADQSFNCSFQVEIED